MSLGTQVSETVDVGARRGVDGAVMAVSGREMITEIAGGGIDSVREVGGTSACLRARAEGRVGTVSTTCLDHPDHLWEQAQSLARFGPLDLEADHTAPTLHSDHAPSPAPEPATRGPGVSLSALQERTGLHVHGTLRERRHEVVQAEVGGRLHSEQQNLVQLDLVLEGGDDSDYGLTWTDWTHCPAAGDWNIDHDAVSWLEWAATWQHRPLRAAPSGLVTMVLTPTALHAALSPLVAALDANEVLSGRSGPPDPSTPVLHPALELWDGGGFSTIDDEGTATRPLRLIAGGQAQTAYHSRYTAARLQAAPTGHGRRGTPLRRELERSIQPVLSDVRLDVLRTGGVGSVRRAPWPELVAGVRRGIVVDSVLGAGQARQGGGAQQRLEGRVRMGWVVERGQVVGRLAPVALSVPLTEVLVAGLRAISLETWHVGRAWTGRLPFAVVSGVRIT